jgi:hypothetical protein
LCGLTSERADFGGLEQIGAISATGRKPLLRLGLSLFLGKKRTKKKKKRRRSGWRESNPHNQLGRLELYH